MRYADEIDLQSPSYTPVRLINETAFWLGAKNLAALATLLELHKSNLTRIVKRKQAVSAELFVRIMDRTGWTLKRVRELAGVPYEGPEPPSAPIHVAEVHTISDRKILSATTIKAILRDPRPRKLIAFDYNITPQHVGVIQRRGIAGHSK